MMFSHFRHFHGQEGRTKWELSYKHVQRARYVILLRTNARLCYAMLLHAHPTNNLSLFFFLLHAAQIAVYERYTFLLIIIPFISCLLQYCDSRTYIMTYEYCAAGTFDGFKSGLSYLNGKYFTMFYYKLLHAYDVHTFLFVLLPLHVVVVPQSSFLRPFSKDGERERSTVVYQGTWERGR